MRVAPHTLRLGREALHRGPLILVNQAHPVRVAADGRTLDATCRRQLDALLDACGGANGRIRLVSGYRSREEQTRIYDTSAAEHGLAFTQQYVARPGESEHQTGLAVDVGEERPDVDFIRPDFPDTGVCGAFRRQAAAYGFVQRYQADKTPITQIACEPWHFRYVGAPHAAIMEARGLCLEEYTAFLAGYAAADPYVHLLEDGREAHLYHVPADERAGADGVTVVPVLGGETCEVSGNNVDGYVVTCLRERRRA
ncbi:D-alanyl-D-alanine carboxypeptidase family protein [Paenibacillus sp. IB182496]|uniref:D-alanyl-D-alanine carboxypeptidase family protein n=1 Tax=Paenibacillus sabuli TaxID=2772509 RepID=A0A927BQA7_9BACL|nr:D-alanyl-D-alanine carboxypeptidase family protein [Paenibacillus sabuli]MBD2843594.1 D-alanyl-D-alanine carboxypeptidase family protein [Paenibacillus sabuli]